MADRWIPPRIMFGSDLTQPMAVKFAYLVRLGDVPWAYANLLEVHKLPADAKAVRLDPTLIVEETSTETGQPVFAYRGMVSFP